MVHLSASWLTYGRGSAIIDAVSLFVKHIKSLGLKRTQNIQYLLKMLDKSKKCEVPVA